MCASLENTTTTATPKETTTDNANTTTDETNSDANGNTTADGLVVAADQGGEEGVMNGTPIPAITSPEEILRNYGANFKTLKSHPQVTELLTIIRDK